MQTLIKSVNQYRVISTRFINFDCNAQNLEFYSYTKIQSQSKMKGISVHNFDTISYLSTSEKGYYHCVGLNGKILTQIILKQSE